MIFKKKKLKIFAFANAFWINGQGLGGGDRRFIEIFKRINGNHVDTTVSISKMGYNNYKERITLNYKVLPFVALDKSGLMMSYLIRTFTAFFLKLNVKNNDILYSTSNFLPDVLPVFMHKNKNKNVKWVQIIHHLIPYHSKRTFLNNFMSHNAEKISLFFIKISADLIIVVNPLVKEQLIKLGFENFRIKVVSDGVDLKYLSHIKPYKMPIFDAVFLGRLHPSKGIFDLIEIWKKIIIKKKDAKLGIIGGGDKQVRSQLEEKLIRNGLFNNVTVLGYLDDAKMSKILKSSKVFIFPSHEEGWGISICEALACGLPVVAWDLINYRKIFGDAIITVKENDVQKFANKTLELLTDNTFYQQFQRKGFKVASKYSWDKVAEQEFTLLEAVAHR